MAVLLHASAAVAEEVWFRRLVYGWLAPAGAGTAIVGSAALFALVHVTTYGVLGPPARSRRRRGARMATRRDRIVAGPGGHPRRREPARAVVSGRLRRLGLVVGALYLLAVGLTLGIRDTAVRPLFDGFAPAPQYRWLAPPTGFSAGNRQPAALRASIAIGPDGSRRTGLGTADGQVVLALGPGAIPAHGADRRVSVRVEPVDGERVRRLPAGLRPNGNAYRITLTYEPSGARVGVLAHPGTLTLAIPEVGRDLFRARPAGWTVVPSRGVPPSLTTLTAPLARPGLYLSGTDLPPPPGPGRDHPRSHCGRSRSRVGGVAIVLLAGAYAIVRRRRRADRATG